MAATPCSHRGMALGDNALEGGELLSPIGVTAAMDLGSSFPCRAPPTPPPPPRSRAVSLFLSAQLPRSYLRRRYGRR